MGLEMIALSTAIFAGATGIPQAVVQRRAGKKSEAAQEQANRVAEAQAQVQNARQRRRAIAQARIAQAQNIAGQSPGVETTGLAGAQSGITSTLGANIAEQRGRIASGQQIQGFQQQSASALRRGREQASFFTAAGDIGQAALAFSGPATRTPGAGNLQGQQTPLFNNPAFVKRF